MFKSEKDGENYLIYNGDREREKEWEGEEEEKRRERGVKQNNSSVVITLEFDGVSVG